MDSTLSYVNLAQNAARGETLDEGSDEGTGHSDFQATCLLVPMAAGWSSRTCCALLRRDQDRGQLAILRRTHEAGFRAKRKSATGPRSCAGLTVANEKPAGVTPAG